MQFKGISAHTGVVKAPVCIVHTADEFNHCRAEHIAVLNKVKPNAALAKRVKGIVGIHGGITSHAAITARENDKPAVVGISETILDALKEGQIIELNADAGTVTLM